MNGKSRDVKGASALLTLSKDGGTPRALHLATRDAQFDVTVKEWQMNGPASAQLFEPPQSASTTEVPQEDLQRFFSALYNYVVEEAN